MLLVPSRGSCAQLFDANQGRSSRLNEVGIAAALRSRNSLGWNIATASENADGRYYDCEWPLNSS